MCVCVREREREREREHRDAHDARGGSQVYSEVALLEREHAVKVEALCVLILLNICVLMPRYMCPHRSEIAVLETEQEHAVKVMLITCACVCFCVCSMMQPCFFLHIDTYYEALGSAATSMMP